MDHFSVFVLAHPHLVMLPIISLVLLFFGWGIYAGWTSTDSSTTLAFRALVQWLISSGFADELEIFWRSGCDTDDLQCWQPYLYEQFREAGVLPLDDTDVETLRILLREHDERHSHA